MGHESTVRILLALGAEVHCSVLDQLGDPLQAAAMCGYETVVRLLLSHGAVVDRNSGVYGTALQAASYRGHLAVVKILVDAGAAINQEGLVLDSFHAAAWGSHENIVRFYLERGYTYSPHYCLMSFCSGHNFSSSRDPLTEASPNRPEGRLLARNDTASGEMKREWKQQSPPLGHMWWEAKEDQLPPRDLFRDEMSCECSLPMAVACESLETVDILL